MIPRVVVAIGLVIGLFGIGGYLKSGNSVSETPFAKQPRKLAEQAMPVAQAATKDVQVTETTTVNKAAPVVSETQIPAALSKAETRMLEPPKQQQPQIETAVSAFLCGAETKKGTPCKHRVKGYIRCFQHAGMPALLPPDKLRIN